MSCGCANSLDGKDDPYLRSEPLTTTPAQDVQDAVKPAGGCAGGPDALLAEGFDELWRPDAPSEMPRGPEGVLLVRGTITTEQLDIAKRRQKEKPQLTCMQVLREMDAVDEPQALQATAEYFRIPYVDLSAEQVAVLVLTTTFGFVTRLEGTELRDALHALIGVIVKGIQL